jgi:ubiquinone/menaquinone biosynthesis C-methylase UbiE
MQTFNAVKLAQQLLIEKVKIAQCVVDATAGNGKDTLFLAKNSCKDAVVWAFDIQQAAIIKTRQLLSTHNLLSKVKLMVDSHANIGSYTTGNIDVAMFNLGYLPNADHKITTELQSTITALREILNVLSVGGIISLVAYPGHQAGYWEQQAIEEHLISLSPEIFTVGCWSMINHVNNPPILYVVEKTRSEACESIASH